MTSRFALLAAIAGTIGLSCSGGDSNSGPPAPPAVPPNFVNNPSSATSNANTSQTTPAPVTQQPSQTTNTEQMPAVTPPASTNNQTAAGTGGTGGGSTPPATTGTAIPTGTGNAITPAAGHVAGTSNGVGIQGDFYTFSDADGTPPGTTTITPKDFSMAMGSQICASGSASQILTPTGATMPAYGQYYGGGIGFNLGDPGGGAQAWPQGKVVGFSFNLTGSTIPTNMRFQAKFYAGSALNTTDAYCTSTVKSGANTIMFSSLLLDCYNATPGAPLPTTVLLQSIQWQVVTGTDAPTPFNFCVDSLTAITSP